MVEDPFINQVTILLKIVAYGLIIISGSFIVSQPKSSAA